MRFWRQRSRGSEREEVFVMRRILIGTILVIFTAANSLAGDASVLRFDGIGPIKIGMSLAQLNLALQERFKMPPARDDQACFYVDSKKHPHINFMILEGRLARIDVETASVSTAASIKIGDSEAQALRVYGSKMKVEPHKYTEGHYLTVRSSTGTYGIRFETDAGKITTFYAGSYEAIRYVEGCE